jgi:hypothetical protein
MASKRKLEIRTKVVFGEDIRCRSDLATVHNSFRAQVDNSDNLRFVQVITISVCVSMYVCV